MQSTLTVFANERTTDSVKELLLEMSCCYLETLKNMAA
jgi:hypothetical protein